MSFYRKYRPQVIDEIDNAVVREQLLLLLKKDRGDLPHAYFFSGPKGTGKTTAARLIAKLFNCEVHSTPFEKTQGKGSGRGPSKNSGPCGKCHQCSSIAAGSNLDVLEIDAASNRGIDEIRELRQRIGLAPISGKYKVYVIDEVHMLTTEASNALLKTLEEPPAHAVFVLATTDPQKVPATIVSRCMHLPFHRATTEELSHVLLRIAKAEKIDVEKDAVALIADLSDGSFRDAAKLLEQVSFHEGKITADLARRYLRISETKRKERFLAALVAHEAKQALMEIDALLAAGSDIKTFIVDVLADLEKELVAIASGTPSDTWEKEGLRQAIRKLTQAYSELRLSPIPQLPLELAVVEYCEDRGKTQMEETRKDAEEGVKGGSSLGLLTIEKLIEHWLDFIATTKPFNHSVAAVLRSSRPKAVENGIVTIEALYKFHQEKLSEAKTRQVLADILKKLFGEKVKVEIVLGKK